MFALTLFTTCKNNSESSNMEASNEKLSLEGAWKLLSYYNYKDDKVSDTIKASESNRQVKMYSATRVMWTRFTTDSLDWFGYGNYTVNDSTLIEVLDYGSKSMNEIIKEQNEFVFDIILEKDKFSQITIDEEGYPVFAENYIRIE